jgi:hypothetical protein
LTAAPHGDRDLAQLPPESLSHTSKVLALVVAAFQRHGRSHVLEVGPTNSANILFLASRIHRLYVCDLYRRLDRCRRREMPFEQLLADLDYPRETFHGILLWDLCDHLNDEDTAALLRRCLAVIRPRGLAVAFSTAFQDRMAPVNAFEVGRHWQVRLRPQPYFNLAVYQRPNREMMKLFSPFAMLKSFIYRNGFREFLFRRDA